MTLKVVFIYVVCMLLLGIVCVDVLFHVESFQTTYETYIHEIACCASFVSTFQCNSLNANLRVHMICLNFFRSFGHRERLEGGNEN